MNLKIKFKGGPGSGDFNHKGRPGMVGGSSSETSGMTDKKSDQELINEGATKARKFTGLYLKAKKAGMTHGISKDVGVIKIARQDKDNFLKSINSEFPVKLSSTDTQFVRRSRDNKYQIIGTRKQYRLNDNAPMGVYEIKIYDVQ